MKKSVLLTALIAYLVSAGVSYVAFGQINPASVAPDTVAPVNEDTLLGSLLQIDPNEPRDQACPLNGQMYTMTERTAWEKKRPLAIMIENSVDARPQSGLGSADVAFEMVAEGGITRFMALFLCNVQREDTIVAPVRSARTYYLDYASGFNYPLYVHVGGANIPGPTNALGQINDYGWAGQNDINQFSVGYPTFVRNANRLEGREVATEHTMESSTERLWEVGTEREWTNMSPSRRVGAKVVEGTNWYDGYTGWTFAEGTPAAGTVNSISYEFWTGYADFAVSWQYDAAANTYKRSQGGAPHLDLNTGEQLAYNNVVVLFTVEKGPLNEAKHMLYTTIGTGRALIFKNGEAVEAKWSKPSREAELQFTTAAGKAIELTRGPVWISVLDTTNKVEY